MLKRKKHNNNTARANPNQIAVLLDYMENYQIFAKAHRTKLGRLGNNKYESMWKNLADLLNEYGPFKNVSSWEQVNIDFCNCNFFSKLNIIII